jgi:Berberine and berberine like
VIGREPAHRHAHAVERGCGGSGCSARTLSGAASRDAALRRWSAWRLAGANSLQPNQRPEARWSILGPFTYGARNYERIVDLKRAYDPTNFFRLNQNIEP